MVFISIGTQKQQFTRIFEKVSNSNILKDKELIAQSGFTKYNNEKIKMITFMEEAVLEKNIKEAEFVICHGGIGTIFNALRNEKKVLVVPRLKKYKEHKNDHQLEICKQLEKEGYLLYLNENEDIDEKIEKLLNTEFKKYISDESYLQTLKNVI